ncbi:MULTISPECIES: tyrosine-type recombinase/integrase [Streptomyces]|uniref:tyrosine-type recombinase/integrase n=1 Tax=Streptomyces TaxID=1883 RepID=UPI0005BC3D6D|nr:MULTISPECIES: tyrosine-type recombinase/integrase [Streptomyces]MDP9953192.1 integrase [Streptomyces sp. DSM 41269]
MPNITARQAAARWGVSDSLARRVLADVDAIDRDLETGAKVYDQDAADAAYNSRPGRGTRTDLTSDVMPAEQVDQLLADDTIPVAHRALWSLLRDGHARIADVLSMDVRDVDPDEGVAQLDHPKLETDPRRIPISDRTAKLVREATAGRDAGPLIAGDRERPVTREAAARFARAAGASIHSFRPKPHTVGKPPRFGTEQIAAADLRVGDTIYLDTGRAVTVETVAQVQAPSGAVDTHINKSTDFPVYISAKEQLTIAKRTES